MNTWSRTVRISAESDTLFGGQDLDPLGKSLGGTAGVTRQLEIHGYNLRHVEDIAEGIARYLRERRSRRIRDVQIDRTYGPPRYEMLAVIDHSKTTRLGAWITPRSWTKYKRTSMRVLQFDACPWRARKSRQPFR